MSPIERFVRARLVEAYRRKCWAEQLAQARREAADRLAALRAAAPTAP